MWYASDPEFDNNNHVSASALGHLNKGVLLQRLMVFQYSMWYNIEQIYLHYCKFQISLLNVQWACNIFIALILEFIYIEPVMTSVCRQNELSCPANQSNLWLRHFIGHFTSTTASFPKINFLLERVYNLTAFFILIVHAQMTKH